jgi:hypothetical protein
MAPTSIAIGTKVYVFDQYIGERSPKDIEGHLNKWREWSIVGENRVSWIVQNGRYESTPFKIDKKTLTPRDDKRIAWTIEEIVAKWNEQQFRLNHAHRIGEAVKAADVETIKKVAALIGYAKHLEKGQ